MITNDEFEIIRKKGSHIKKSGYTEHDVPAPTHSQIQLDLS